MWLINFLMCCWICSASVLLRILCLCLSGILPCSFLSFLSLCQILVSDIAALQNELGKSPSSSVFWNHLCRIGNSTSLYVWKILAVNPSGPGLFFVDKFLNTDSILELNIGLFRVSIYGHSTLNMPDLLWKSFLNIKQGP